MSSKRSKRRIFSGLLAASFALSSAAIGQVPNLPDQPTSTAAKVRGGIAPANGTLQPSVPTLGDDFGAKVGQIRSIAKGGNAAAVETEILKLSQLKAGTPAQKIETAQGLLDVARTLSRDGDVASVRALADRAQARLKEVDVPTTDKRVRARAKSITAILQEKYAGDPKAAIASYKEALLLAPDDKASKEALDRLVMADAVLEARLKQYKK